MALVAAVASAAAVTDTVATCGAGVSVLAADAAV